MKRMIAAFVAGLLVLAATGCSRFSNRNHNQPDRLPVTDDRAV